MKKLPENMLIDTHCHLTDKKIENIDGVLARARKAGVERVIVPSDCIEDAKKVVDLTEEYGEVFGLVGIHPEKVTEVERIDEEIEEVKKILQSSKKMVGIGEIGLDFYWDKEKKTKDKQMEIFRKQMELAVEVDVPVVIHTREAEEEMMEVLSTMKRLPRGQFHCFYGSEDLLKWILKNDFWVSFCGNVTYKSADKLRDLVKRVPLTKLLLETDSPYLSPEPLRGRLNEPGNVKIIGRFIAEILEINFEDLIKQIRENTLCLFF